MSFHLDWNLLLSEQRAARPDREPRLVAPAAPEIPPPLPAGSSVDTSLPPPLPSTPPPLPAPSGASFNTRTAFEKDYDRVIFSAPFRRLAGKTQVHPFAPVDHVHNRLTHTLEVASLGRSLAYAVGRLLTARGQMPAGRTPEDLSCIVQSACLAHDIGNPPFGHAGEFAIRAWAREHLPALFPGQTAGPLTDALHDWHWFEGNAQGFRLVARADNRDQDYFLFTYASLGAMIKYPWTADDPRTDREKKHNAFSSERPLFNEVLDTLGLRRPDGSVVRHPLSFLSEAADDICYRIADFEDAVEMGILGETEVRQIFTQIIGRESRLPLSGLRAQAIGVLVQAATDTFARHYEAIMAGERSWDRDLKSDFPEPIRVALRTIKDRYDSIFGHRTKVAVELGAHAILSRILTVYVRAVKELARVQNYKDRLGFVHKRCLALAWKETYIIDNQHQTEAWWLGRVMDHVSGMTDAYATQVSREIEGA